MCMRGELIKKHDMRLGIMSMFVAGMYMCVYMCVYKYLYVCMYVYECMHMFECMHVCVYGDEMKLGFLLVFRRGWYVYVNVQVSLCKYLVCTCVFLHGW